MNSHELLVEDPNCPLISAFMVVGRQPQWQVQLAVNCFTNQTWPNKELIIINNATTQYEAAGLDLVLPRSADGKRHIATVIDTDRQMSLGMCRNLAISVVHGDVLVQFDSHCWHHPTRLQVQFGELRKHEHHICMLRRALEYSYGSGLLGPWSNPKGIILNSLMTLRPRSNDYADVDKAEELTLLTGLIAAGYKPMTIDRPDLLCRMHYSELGQKRMVGSLPGVDPPHQRQMRKVVRQQALG